MWSFVFKTLSNVHKDWFSLVSLSYIFYFWSVTNNAHAQLNSIIVYWILIAAYGLQGTRSLLQAHHRTHKHRWLSKVNMKSKQLKQCNFEFMSLTVWWTLTLELPVCSVDSAVQLTGVSLLNPAGRCYSGPALSGCKFGSWELRPGNQHFVLLWNSHSAWRKWWIVIFVLKWHVSRFWIRCNPIYPSNLSKSGTNSYIFHITIVWRTENTKIMKA